MKRERERESESERKWLLCLWSTWWRAIRKRYTLAPTSTLPRATSTMQLIPVTTNNSAVVFQWLADAAAAAAAFVAVVWASHQVRCTPAHHATLSESKARDFINTETLSVCRSVGLLHSTNPLLVHSLSPSPNCLPLSVHWRRRRQRR